MANLAIIDNIRGQTETLEWSISYPKPNSSAETLLRLLHLIPPMESILHSSSSLVSLGPRIDGRDSFINSPRVCFIPSLGRRGSKSLPLVAAAKKKKSKRDDNHSFSARPDEATGPFPESILLKEVPFLSRLAQSYCNPLFLVQVQPLLLKVLSFFVYMNWVLQKKVDEEGDLLPEFADDEESK